MKPYVLRGKTSEWTAYDFGSDYRNRSAQRGYATGRTSPYKSEFDLDGSLHRRSTFYSPPRLSPRSSRAYLAAKAAALGLPRSGGVSEWSRESSSPSMSHDVSPELPQPRSTRSSEVDGPQLHGGHREQGGSGGGGIGTKHFSTSDESRHRDLKRKMVFDLHREISKSAQTTHLEEISDMDKITDICFSNLKVMMENKKHRKYLHHMNNNALTMSSMLLKKLEYNVQNFTNNAFAKREVKSSMNAKKLAMDGTLARKASLKPAEFIQAVSPIDPLKVRGPKLPLQGGFKREKTKATLETVPSKTMAASQKKDDSMREDSTSLFIAELEDQIESSKKEVARPSIKHVPLMTPEEILACHYLRLNQDQVARLEKCIRDKGHDPGIHVHMDVTNYDVFGEIRRIRQNQKPGVGFEYDEEEEEEIATQQKDKFGSSRRNSAASSTTKSKNLR